ncbi:hypothetical protein [Candidatus Darwinibacter acetoxidans]
MSGFYPFNPALGQEVQTDVKGVTLDRGFVAHFVAANPAAASDTSVLAATTLTTSTQEITTGITNPDFPRALQIKGNQAGITGDVVIEGTNYADEGISETILANGANAVSGNKAFKTVTKITLPAKVGEGDTISVGTTGKLGLPYKLPHNTVLAAYLNNVKEGTAPTVATSTSALESNTVLLNSDLNGNKVDVYLIV